LVDAELHTLEMVFQYLGLEIGHPLGGIILDGRLAVLYHDATILVIGVDQGESRGGQGVKEAFFGLEVIVKGQVVIKVIAGDVGENASCEL